MLTDIIQIVMGLLFVTSVGLWWRKLSVFMGWSCDAELIPLAGTALLALLLPLLWRFNVPMPVIFLLMIAAGVLAIGFLWKERGFLRIHYGPQWIAGCLCAAIVMMLAIQGSTGSSGEKLCQAFCFDRLTYVNAGISFSFNTWGRLLKIKKDVLTVGDYSYLHNHIIYGSALEQAERRPTPVLLFSLLNFDARTSYSLLGNAYEVFLRVLQFFATIYLFRSMIVRKSLAIIAAGATSFGYWSQYIKETNSWGMQLSLPMIIVVIAAIYRILARGKTAGDRPHRSQSLALLALFASAAMTTYIEGTGIAGVAISGSLLLVFILSPGNRRDIAYAVAVVFSCIVGCLLVFPFLRTVIEMHSHLAEVSTALNCQIFPFAYACDTLAHSVINPYSFSIAQRIDFINHPSFSSTTDVLSLVASISTAALGLFFLNSQGIILPLLVCTIITCVTFREVRRHYWPHHDIGVFYYLMLMFILPAIIVPLVLFSKKFNALHAFEYCFPQAVAILTLFLSSRNAVIARSIAIFMLLADVYVGAGYPLLTEGVDGKVQVTGRAANYHMTGFYNLEGVNPEFREHYNIELRNIRTEFTKCRSVFIDLDNYWYQIYIVQFLEANSIRYDTALPNLTGGFSGDKFAPGKLVGETNDDCTVYSRLDPENRAEYALRRNNDDDR